MFCFLAVFSFPTQAKVNSFLFGELSSSSLAPRDTLRGMMIKYKSADTPDEEIYTQVDEMPTFPSGEDGLKYFLKQNLVYPEEAIKDSIEGNVIVSFIVRFNGTVDNPQIEESLAPAFDEEALRVVKAMPKWHPGEQYGEPVSVRMSLPVAFKYEEKAITEELPDIPMGNLENLIFYVDGEKKEFKDLIGLDSTTVESVKVYNGDEAIKEYGQDAKHGVISIKLKKKESELEY